MRVRREDRARREIFGKFDFTGRDELVVEGVRLHSLRWSSNTANFSLHATTLCGNCRTEQVSDRFTSPPDRWEFVVSSLKEMLCRLCRDVNSGEIRPLALELARDARQREKIASLNEAGYGLVIDDKGKLSGSHVTWLPDYPEPKQYLIPPGVTHDGSEESLRMLIELAQALRTSVHTVGGWALLALPNLLPMVELKKKQDRLAALQAHKAKMRTVSATA